MIYVMLVGESDPIYLIGAFADFNEAVQHAKTHHYGQRWNIVELDTKGEVTVRFIDKERAKKRRAPLPEV